jgi:hypothetical protein
MERDYSCCCVEIISSSSSYNGPSHLLNLETNFRSHVYGNTCEVDSNNSVWTHLLKNLWAHSTFVASTNLTNLPQQIGNKTVKNAICIHLWNMYDAVKSSKRQNKLFRGKIRVVRKRYGHHNDAHTQKLTNVHPKSQSIFWSFLLFVHLQRRTECSKKKSSDVRK